MKRSLSIVLIVLFWTVMTALHFTRERSAPRLDRSSLDAELTEPTETWLALYAGNSSTTDGLRDDQQRERRDERGESPLPSKRQKVGYVHLQQIPETRGSLAGVTQRLATRLDLELFGRRTELDLSGSAWRPFDQPLANFEFDVRSGEFHFRVEGRITSGELNGQVTSAGETLPLHLEVGDDLLFGSGVTATYRFPDLDVGETVTLDSFDPLTFGKSETTVRCVARQLLDLAAPGSDTTPVRTRVLEVTSSGMTTRAWIDDQGEIVRASTPLGLVLERTTAELALASSEPGAGMALLGLTAIRPRGKRPTRGLSRIEISLSSFPEAGLPSDSFQTFSTDGWSADGSPNRGSLVRTRQASHAEVLDRAERRSLLSGDAFIQVDHERIRSQSLTLTADLESDRDKALAIYEFVYRTLDKSPALSIPSAIEVLENERGDCNEHTVLYTALARAAGLPTRIAIGVVWSDELDGFYYHAWPEVYLSEVAFSKAQASDGPFAGGTFMALDPTLGQPQADATHIKLLEGGIETWTRLLPYLGALELEVKAVSSEADA